MTRTLAGLLGLAAGATLATLLRPATHQALAWLFFRIHY